jgi:GDP-D-mannose dehydratase
VSHEKAPQKRFVHASHVLERVQDRICRAQVQERGSVGRPAIEVDEQRIRPGQSEVERLWADNTKAKQVAQWSPAYGGREGFERGLAATIAWFTNADHLKLYKSDRYTL